MWIGDKIYFLSDRNGPMTLFRYDPQSRQVTELIKNSGKEIVFASAGPGGIVYEQFGQIHVYDLVRKRSTWSRSTSRRLDGSPSAVSKCFDPRFAARISPTGVRAVFEAHGEILSAPAENGDIRNLSNSPGSMDRAPAWSPDGKSIAYFSDESGEYALHVRSQNGGEPKKIPLAGNFRLLLRPAMVARQQTPRLHR